LGGFATNQVNLTKLESFSVKNTFDQANFYLDLEGSFGTNWSKKGARRTWLSYRNFRHIGGVRIFNF
jgi:prephenate dehydratase